MVTDVIIVFWAWCRSRTFDKLAERCYVKYVEVEGVDFENTSGLPIYEYNKLKELWKKQEAFDTVAKKNHPVLFFLLRSYPEFITDILYYIDRGFKFIRRIVKYGIFDKQNVIKTKLSVNWHDTDAKIVAAIESLIIDFVEKECSNMYDVCYPQEKINLTEDTNKGVLYLQLYIDDSEIGEDSKKHKQNVIDIYNYFKNDRKLLELEIEEFDDSRDIKEYIELEKKLYNEDTKYCTMFVESRGVMWT